MFLFYPDVYELVDLKILEPRNVLSYELFLMILI